MPSLRQQPAAAGRAGRERRRAGAAMSARIPPRPLLGGVLAAAALAGAAGAQEERPAEIIAVQIRKQGFACEEAQSAVRDRKASAPNAVVWILRCKNATYRVRLTPDMAAQVERID